MLKQIFHKPVIDPSLDGLEKQAQVQQQAFMVKGIAAGSRKKAMGAFLLTRPKNPFASIASETLAMAILEFPLQRNTKPGVIVSSEGLMSINSAMSFAFDLPDERSGRFFVYSDSSCVIAECAEDGMVRALTLPLRIQSKKLRCTVTGRAVGVKARMGKVEGRAGLQFTDGKDVTVIRTDLSIEDGAGMEGVIGTFFEDLLTEIYAIFNEADRSVSPYMIEPADLGTQSDGSATREIMVPTAPGLLRAYDSRQYGWMMRPMAYGIFDVHLPRFNLSPAVVQQVERYLETAMRLAALRSGFDVSRYYGSFMIHSENPIGGAVRLVYGRTVGDILSSAYTSAEQGADDRDAIRSYLDEVTRIVSDVLSSISPYGFDYQGIRGMVGSWAPFIPASVHFQSESVRPASDDTVELLGRRLEFEERRLMALYRSLDEARNLSER